MNHKLAKFIFSTRKKQNLSQEFMASLLNISRPTYIQIEQGSRDITLNEAKKLAAIFDMTFDDFINGLTKENEVLLEKKEKIKKDNSLKIRITQKNLDKFKQVLLYVLEKVGSKPSFGETVLHKILYFIDFDYFEKFEETLMGATYIKNHHGPTSVELGTIITDMQKNGEIEAVKSSYFKYDQKKYLPIKRANLKIISAREKDHIDAVLARLADKNAKEIENYSHNDIPWKITLEGKPISYESVFYRDERYSVRNYDDDL